MRESDIREINNLNTIPHQIQSAEQAISCVVAGMPVQSNVKCFRWGDIRPCKKRLVLIEDNFLIVFNISFVLFVYTFVCTNVFLVLQKMFI